MSEYQVREIARDEAQKAVKEFVQRLRDDDQMLRLHGLVPTLKGMALNTERAAEYCGYRGGGSSMRNLKARGLGPKSHRLGKMLIYFPADLDEWLRENAVPVEP